MKNHSNLLTKRLENIVDNIIEEASAIKEDERATGPKVQSILDTAEKFKPLIPYILPEKIEENAVIWEEVLNQTKSLKLVYENILPISDTAGTVLGTASVSTSGSIIPIGVPFSSDPIKVSLLENFNDYLYRPSLKSDVVELLYEFHLDISPALKESPLHLFLLAHQAFENPISKKNSAITSLIPIREAIRQTFEELIKMLPEQKQSGNDRKKILLICSEIKKPLISEIVVQEWADLWHEINDVDLSVSKEESMSRDEWKRRLMRSTNFLKTFLSGLDSSKLNLRKKN